MHLPKLGSLLLASFLALGSTGCLKKILTDGQIASTRKGSAAFQTMSDWETARRAASAGLAQFEGMHYLAPYNEDALFLLAKGWSGLSFGFIEDEMERAEDEFGEDSEQAQYHRARAVAAYTRAVFYGSKLLEMRHPGFEAAKKNADTMNAWLAEFEGEDDVEYLMWTGQAWMSRVNLLKDDPETVAELYIGYLLVKRSVELDPNYNYGSGHAILASYHARSAMAELEDSKKHFDASFKINEGKALLVKLNYAAKYHCVKVNKEEYVKVLKEVVNAGDVMPEQRLPNTIANSVRRWSLSTLRGARISTARRTRRSGSSLCRRGVDVAPREWLW
jgi:hypothetical protein